MMKIEQLREIWADMFIAIDNFVTKTHQKYPEISDFIDREAIKKAVIATQEYDNQINKEDS